MSASGRWWRAGAVGVVLIGALVSLMAFQDTRETSAAEFEYTRITLGAERDPAADIAALNAAGRLEGGRARSGWRLVTIVSNPVPTSSTPYFAYLMRERR